MGASAYNSLIYRTGQIPNKTKYCFFNGELIKPDPSCRYLGIQIYANLSFGNHLNSVMSKMATAIRALYFVRIDLPRRDIFKQTLTTRNIQ